MICYVCGNEIKGTSLPVYIGQGKYRHVRCYPGKAKWMQSEVGQKSKLKEVFTKEAVK